MPVNAKDTSAMVFAAGLGTRMRPITDRIPKPMVEIAGKPLLDHCLDRLDNAEISTIVVNTHYKADIIQKHLASRPEIHISHEDTLLETAGGVRNALPLLNSRYFFTMNADILYVDGKDKALTRLLNHFDPSHMQSLLLLHPKEKAIGYQGKGDFDLDDQGRLIKREGEEHPYVFTGIQLTCPAFFQHINQEIYSISAIYKHLTHHQHITHCHGLIHQGDWLHIGTPNDLEQANLWYEKHRGKD